MSGLFIRKMEIAELEEFYIRIVNDFAVGEYPPQPVLSKQLRQGIQQGFVLHNGSENLGYSICASSNVNNCTLITLFATFEEYRGQGLGSAFLSELIKIFSQKQAVLVEVERPELAVTPAERENRLRRIAFYEREGFQLIKGIDYCIWDIPMYLMVMPIISGGETIMENIKLVMQQIYINLLGSQFIHKMEFK